MRSTQATEDAAYRAIYYRASREYDADIVYEEGRHYRPQDAPWTLWHLDWLDEREWIVVYRLAPEDAKKLLTAAFSPVPVRRVR